MLSTFYLFNYPRLSPYLTIIAIFSLVLCSSGCTRTDDGGTGITTTTIATPSGCCPELVQTNSTSTDFIDGLMTFAYNSDTCRTMVTATCTSTQNPTLNAGIIANTDNFLSIGVGSTSFPGTCVNGQWEMGSPALVVQTLQCQLTQS